MFNSGFTQPERRLRNLLRVWVVSFFVVGVAFAISPGAIVDGLNATGQWLHWTGPELTPTTDHLWHVLAIALMGLLVAMSSRAIKELGHSLLLVRLIMMSKVISGVGYIVVLSSGDACFAYMAGAVVDLGIAGITFYFYRQVVALKGTL